MIDMRATAAIMLRMRPCFSASHVNVSAAEDLPDITRRNEQSAFRRRDVPQPNQDGQRESERQGIKSVEKCRAAHDNAREYAIA